MKHAKKQESGGESLETFVARCQKHDFELSVAVVWFGKSVVKREMLVAKVRLKYPNSEDVCRRANNN